MARKRERFVEHYLVSGNSAQAAQAAGYSPRTAGSQGSGLLKNVDIQAALAVGRAKLAAQMITIRKDIEQELCAIAFGNITDVASWGADGVMLWSPEQMCAADKV